MVRPPRIRHRASNPDDARRLPLQTATLTTFRDLSADEAEALLRAHHVGRVAYAWREHVDIEPIHYVYEDGAIWLRTSNGAKLLTLRHSPWLAFEVDETSGLYDWKSVVAHGTAYALRADGPPHEAESFARGLELLRRLEPAALTPDDPVPWRNVVLRIQVDSLRGRAATSGAAYRSE
jgi:nitroimidazol reductase NimA-like FMN-containing flavoprotein (pyridoxamine 5'-phosphate oxidase superfamily)